MLRYSDVQQMVEMLASGARGDARLLETSRPWQRLNSMGGLSGPSLRSAIRRLTFFHFIERRPIEHGRANRNVTYEYRVTPAGAIAVNLTGTDRLHLGYWMRWTRSGPWHLFVDGPTAPCGAVNPHGIRFTHGYLPDMIICRACWPTYAETASAKPAAPAIAFWPGYVPESVAE